MPRVEGVGLDITRLLEVRTWRAFDVDDDGRVLAGSDDTGCVQLVELAAGPAGSGATVQATPLTALPGACRGRYLHGGRSSAAGGERVVVVEHDDGGNERGQLSLLPLEGQTGPATLADLTPLVHDPEYVHHLLEVLPGRVVYNTNRRNGVDFDVVMRNVATGVEEVLYDRGGWAQQVTVSPDARYAVIALTGSAPMSDELVLVDSMPETAGEHVLRLTSPGARGQHDRVCWLAGHLAFVVATDATTDHTRIVRYDLDGGQWRPLVTDEEHDLVCWPSPDGRLLLVETNDDGASRLALHSVTAGAASGERLRDVPLPGDGVVVYPMPDPRWSPNSRYLAISYTSPAVAGDVLLLDTADGPGRPVALTSSSGQLDGERLSTPAVHLVPTPDGERVPCFVYPPTASGGDGAGSAVLVIHGGPESQSRPIFNPVVQAMAANGHTVLVPNVRGSTGYGARWYSADDVRRRLDSVGDLAALHAWLPSLGLDPARAALWGGSYGAGRARVPAGAVGGRRRHRRHLLARDVPAEHLAVPARGPRAGVRLARRRRAVPAGRLAAVAGGRDQGAAVRDPRRERPTGATVRGRAARRRGVRQRRGLRAAGVPGRGPRPGQTRQPAGRLPEGAVVPAAAPGGCFARRPGAGVPAGRRAVTWRTGCRRLTYTVTCSDR